MPDKVLYKTQVDTPFGSLWIQHDGIAIYAVNFSKNNSNVDLPDQVLDVEISTPLKAYFSTGKTLDDVSVCVHGTTFQRRVWRALRRIPFGETRTYGELADSLKTSPRAIGNACRNNPVPVIVPCHRVVSKQGAGGFCGETEGSMLNIKQWLLAHEVSMV